MHVIVSIESRLLTHQATCSSGGHIPMLPSSFSLFVGSIIPSKKIEVGDVGSSLLVSVFFDTGSIGSGTRRPFLKDGRRVGVGALRGRHALRRGATLALRATLGAALRRSVEQRERHVGLDAHL